MKGIYAHFSIAGSDIYVRICKPEGDIQDAIQESLSFTRKVEELMDAIYNKNTYIFPTQFTAPHEYTMSHMHLMHVCMDIAEIIANSRTSTNYTDKALFFMYMFKDELKGFVTSNNIPENSIKIY
jgi:cAMP phosphodiesterase